MHPLGIIPLLHFPRTHYSYVIDSPCTRCPRIHKEGSTARNKFDKIKMCGKLKVRTFAYGRPQKCYIPKEEASSPTIYLGSLFTSLVINLHEGRYLAVFDVPGAYLKADITEEKPIILKLKVNSWTSCAR